MIAHSTLMFYLFIQLIQSVKRDINSNTRKLSADTKYILDLALGQEVSHITRRFSDLIDMKTRVCKLPYHSNYLQVNFIMLCNIY